MNLIPTAFAASTEHAGPHIPALMGESTGIHLWPLSVTTTMLSTWIFMVVLFVGVGILYRASRPSGSPRIRAIGIDLIARLDAMFTGLIGSSSIARRYLWLVAGFFIFIFFANIFGLILDVINLIIPSAHAYLRPINSDLNTTLIMATTIILVAQAAGVWVKWVVHHYGHYVMNFRGNTLPEKCINFFIGWLHFFGEVIRIGSLSLRLFLNIFVGVILIGVAAHIGGLLPGYGIGQFLTLPFWFFELLVAFLQAYIFMTLSGLYLKESHQEAH